ncbi:energy transducer TonB [Hymenobacter busanensis]|uniref:Energy transducer TonB n=1 Tax=Hymenobacter busanensis TaxID=2607656 RepID=A0A7L5A0C1_9BACT|nr:energy transducer TonB [Hymenobacter busanensis]KAA9338603.1 energy transducer TonB [Hymenobacter busanensis]QHJ08968.1 TonB family protein [Hymenobacter busanensis]
MIRLFRFGTLAALLLAATPAALAQQKLKYPKASPVDIYDAVEKPAVPIGGVEAYANYLGDKLNYPTVALQAGVEGTVETTFVVEKTGYTSGWTVTKSLSPECDAEALRLIKAGPRWKPAEHRGGVVRQRVTVPITFKMPLGAGGAAPQDPAAQAGVAAGAASSSAGPQVVTPDEPARPVGGTDAFFEWVQKNQKYPALAWQRKIQGKVMMEFMIEKDGSLSNIKPVKRLGSGLDEEAIRLIKASPKWEPAKYKGQPVRQKMVLPILFQL